MKKFILAGILFLFSLSVFAQSYVDLINKSADYIEKRDYVAAEQVIKEALRKEPANPGNTLLLTNLGTIQRYLGKKDEAILSYSAALANAPKATYLLHDRAALYCELEKFDEALRDYNSILLIDENDIEAYYRRGLLYLDNNNIPAAKEDFYKIESIDPEDILGKLGIALAYKQQGDWKDAEDIYTDLIYKDKTNGSLYYNRAECYANTDKNSRAIDDLNRAQQLGYKDYTLFVLRGQIRLKQYDKVSAKLDFTRAKELGANEEFIDKQLKKCE